MRAEFDNPSAVEHGDAVRIAHSRDTVRDEDGRSALHHIAKVVQDPVFGLCVDAG